MSSFECEDNFDAQKGFQRWATTDAHPIIASSVFHYEFEFIHPFADGNGRMGRLWQSFILNRWNPISSPSCCG